MKVVFLGGADAGGACSVLLELDGRRWVIDCGSRSRGDGPERWPRLSILEGGAPPTAILLTHGHLENVGALPELHGRYPQVPVHTTPPTIAFARAQLLEAVQASYEHGIEEELPRHAGRAVRSLLSRMVPVQPFRPFRPDVGGPEVTFFPSGHLPGACSIGIVGREARVFLSGDIALDGLRAVPGMRPPRFRADVAILDATGGVRLPPSRAAEEDRWVEAVAAAVSAGGKVLIPVSPLGRGQEIILALLRAQTLQRMPRVPIFVDGAARFTCAAFSGFPWYLPSSMRRRIEKQGDAFFGASEPARAVRGREDRRAILAGPPCVVVAGSGLLSGGPSEGYARVLAKDSRNLIAIPGGSDEESPGQPLLDLAAGRAAFLSLGGKEMRVRCEVVALDLAMHASGAQVASLARSLRPRHTLLVHGDAASRRDLADQFMREKLGDVRLPANGESFALSPRGSRSGRGSRLAPAVPAEPTSPAAARGIGPVAAMCGRPPSDRDLARLADHVRSSYREDAALTAIDLYCFWAGSPPATDADAASFEEALRASTHFFPHPTRLFHFVAAQRSPGLEGLAGIEDEGALCARIDDALPPGSDLLRKSHRPGEPRMLLTFAFPSVAKEDHGALLDEVFRGSGWTYEIDAMPSEALLVREIRQRMPDPRLLSGTVSVRADEGWATVFLSRALRPEEELSWRAAADEVLRRTGFRLGFAARASTPAARDPRRKDGRIELNTAYQAVRDAFASERHAPYRVGKKPPSGDGEPRIEVSFISPEVGARYREKLDRLGRELGWRLEISAAANQNAILEEARCILRGISLRRGPSLVASERKITVRLAAPSRPADWSRLAHELQARTGYRLETEDR